MGKILYAHKTKVRNSKKIVGRRIVNKVLQDATGQEIDFPLVETADAVKVGDQAEINKKPINGDYVMPDATIYHFSSGVLKKITPPGKDAFAMRDRSANLRMRLVAKKNNVNTTAAPGNRFDGVVERIKNLKRKNR